MSGARRNASITAEILSMFRGLGWRLNDPADLRASQIPCERIELPRTARQLQRPHLLLSRATLGWTVSVTAVSSPGTPVVSRSATADVAFNVHPMIRNAAKC